MISFGYAEAVSAALSRGYSDAMEDQGEPDRYVLFVTGPLRERLYRRFSSIFDGRDDVVVRIDRRVSERRRTARGPRRRRTPRRRSPSSPPDWIVPPPEGV